MHTDNTGNNASEGNTPVEFLTLSTLIGNNIINRQGESLGKLHEIMINVSDGKIDYVVIESGGFLGMNQKYFAVSFQSLTPAREHSNAFILNETKESVKRYLRFDKGHWPDPRSVRDDSFV